MKSLARERILKDLFLNFGACDEGYTLAAKAEPEALVHFVELLQTDIREAFKFAEATDHRSKEYLGWTLGRLAVYKDLSKQDLSSLDLGYCLMYYTDFSEANLDEISTRHSRFIGAKFTNASIKGAHFSNADLSYADFRGACLDGTTIVLSMLDHAIIPKELLDKGIFEKCCMTNAKYI